MRRAGTVLTYLTMPGEPNLAALPGLLPRLSFVVTRAPTAGALSVHPMDSPLELHPLGFRQPVAEARVVPVEEIDLALVPGLVFDERGTRLGRGKGHFDELLARLRPDALRVGVTPSALVVPSLPEDLHDVPMTHLASEQGVAEVG